LLGKREIARGIGRVVVLGRAGGILLCLLASRGVPVGHSELAPTPLVTGEPRCCCTGHTADTQQRWSIDLASRRVALILTTVSAGACSSLSPPLASTARFEGNLREVVYAPMVGILDRQLAGTPRFLVKLGKKNAALFSARRARPLAHLHPAERCRRTQPVPA